MRIGIDISQMAFQGTGVANYLENLVRHLIAIDKENEYILFFSSFRKNFTPQDGGFNFQSNPNIQIKKFKIPPTLLDFLWNRLHIMPIEKFIGDVDVFISSDWTEPPTRRAKKATILYDLVVYKYPEETHEQTKFDYKKFLIRPNIVAIQKRKLKWMTKECDAILCISESTKKDAQKILGIDAKKLFVAYPGFSL